MPTGFDTRQPGTSTFASNTPAPVQVAPSAQGGSRGAEMVGGQSTGGVVSSSAHGPAMAGELGGFFAQIMEPHVKARQQEEFIKGAVDQMSRQAGDEIHSSKGGFSKIFGQTSYVEGAVNYTVQKTASQWGLDTLAKMDDLKRMTPDGVAKYVSDSVTKMSTGDPYTDRMVQAAVFEASGPVIQTIAKQRYIYQQHLATSAQAANMDTSATLLQQVGSASAGQTAPSEADTAANVQAHNNYLSAIKQPTGMDDATYVKSITAGALRAAQAGNGYAVSALMSNGAMDMMEPKDRVALQDSIDRYAGKANSDLVLHDPQVMAQVTAIEAYKRSQGMDPAKVEQMGLELNQYVMRKTGFDVPLFDSKAIIGMGASVIQAADEQMKRTQARNDALADRVQKREWDREDKQTEVDQTTAAVNIAYMSGNSRSAMAQGTGTSGMYDTVAKNDFVAGNYAPLLSNFRKENWVSGLVQNSAQGQIRAAIGDQYSPAVDAAHKQWAALRKSSPALASAIYGDYDVQLSKYDQLVGGGIEPQTAYASAFMDPSQYRTKDMPPERVKEATTLIKAVVDGEGPWKVLYPLPFQRTGMNETSKTTLHNVLWSDMAVQSGNSNLPSPVISAQVLERAVRSGRVERYGSLLWSNPTGTTPVGQLLGLVDQGEADKVVMQAADDKLKAAGFAPGAYGQNVAVIRHNDEHGQPALYVLGYDGREDHPASVVIHMDDLKARAAKLKQPNHSYSDTPLGKRLVGHPVDSFVASIINPSGTVADPHRKVPGESAVDRLKRIKRETAH